MASVVSLNPLSQISIYRWSTVISDSWVLMKRPGGKAVLALYLLLVSCRDVGKTSGREELYYVGGYEFYREKKSVHPDVVTLQLVVNRKMVDDEVIDLLISEFKTMKKRFDGLITEYYDIDEDEDEEKDTDVGTLVEYKKKVQNKDEFVFTLATKKSHLMILTRIFVKMLVGESIEKELEEIRASKSWLGKVFSILFRPFGGGSTEEVYDEFRRLMLSKGPQYPFSFRLKSHLVDEETYHKICRMINRIIKKMRRNVREKQAGGWETKRSSSSSSRKRSS